MNNFCLNIWGDVRKIATKGSIIDTSFLEGGGGKGIRTPCIYLFMQHERDIRITDILDHNKADHVLVSV